MKYLKILFILVICPLLLTGCYDKNELDNLAYVIALGVDIGEDKNLNITYQIAIPLNIAGENSNAGKENFTTYTVSAPSLYSANSVVNSITTKEINLSHIKIVIYSEELARSDLAGHINSLISNVDIRPKTAVAICRGKAEDFLNEVAPILESSPARYYDLMLSAYQYTSESASTELIDFYSACQSYDRDAIAVIAENFERTSVKQFGANSVNGGIPGGEISLEGKAPSDNESSSDSSGSEGSGGSSSGGESSSSEGSSSEGSSSESSSGGSSGGEGSSGGSSQEEGKETRFAGLAVFKGSKMVGEISPSLVLPYLILNNSLNEGTIIVEDVEDKEKLASITLLEHEAPKFNVSFENGIPKVKIDISISAHLQSSGGTTNYLDKKNKQALKKEIEEKITSIIQEYLDKTIELGCDISGIGRYAKKHYLTWQEFDDSNWKENYKNLKYEINMNIDLDVSRIIFHRLPNT